MEGLVTNFMADRIIKETHTWKKTLRSAKKQHTVERMERASEEVWSMDAINLLLDNKVVWSSMDQTMKKAQQDQHVRKI